MSEKISLAATQEKFRPRILDNHPVKCLVSDLDGRQYGYVQAYLNNAYIETSELIQETEGVSIDYFIGDALDIGKGLGQKMLKEFPVVHFPRLFSKEMLVTLYHVLDNARAIHCSLATGFVHVRTIQKDNKNCVVLKWSRAP